MLSMWILTSSERLAILKEKEDKKRRKTEKERTKRTEEEREGRTCKKKLQRTKPKKLQHRNEHPHNQRVSQRKLNHADKNSATASIHFYRSIINSTTASESTSTTTSASATLPPLLASTNINCSKHCECFETYEDDIRFGLLNPRKVYWQNSPT